MLDVMEKTGMQVSGMSFPSMVSLTLSSLIETVKRAGHIPDRDGFEFLEKMAPYMGDQRTGRKLDITRTISNTSSDLAIKPLAAAGRALAGSEQPAPAAPVPVPLNTEQRLQARRLTELLQKKDLADEKDSGVIWSAEDESEFQQLYRVIYPDG